MKKFRNYIARKLIVELFAEVSTTTFAHKEAGRITLFDAMTHYGVKS